MPDNNLLAVLEQLRQEIEERIHLFELLVHRVESLPAESNGEQPPARRNLSPAARKRIAAAQRKRWAEHRRQAALLAKENR
jgi:hypothetical protein